jgi:hypothetical protein
MVASIKIGFKAKVRPKTFDMIGTIYIMAKTTWSLMNLAKAFVGRFQLMKKIIASPTIVVSPCPVKRMANFITSAAVAINNEADIFCTAITCSNMNYRYVLKTFPYTYYPNLLPKNVSGQYFIYLTRRTVIEIEIIVQVFTIIETLPNLIILTLNNSNRTNRMKHYICYLSLMYCKTSKILDLRNSTLIEVRIE